MKSTDSTKLHKLNALHNRLEAELHILRAEEELRFSEFQVIMNELDLLSAIWTQEADREMVWDFWINRLEAAGLNVYFNSDWKIEFIPEGNPIKGEAELEEELLAPEENWFRADPELLPADHLAGSLFGEILNWEVLPHIVFPRLIGSFSYMIDDEDLTNLRERLIDDFKGILLAYNEAREKSRTIEKRIVRIQEKKDRIMIQNRDALPAPDSWTYWIERAESAGISLYYHKPSKSFINVMGDHPRETVERIIRYHKEIPPEEEAEDTFFRAKAHIVPDVDIIRKAIAFVPESLHDLVTHRKEFLAGFRKVSSDVSLVEIGGSDYDSL